ncbi:MAG: VPLPA-CTERM sorting domain-containing protein [Pseudomonadota bacterium]
MRGNLRWILRVIPVLKHIFATVFFGILISAPATAATVSSTLLTDSAFSAATIVEQPVGEIRDGGPGTWELGVGRNTQSTPNSTNAHYTHTTAFTAFTLMFGAAQGDLSLTVGATTISFNVGTGFFDTFNALGIRAEGRDNKGNVEGSTFIRNLTLDGMSLSTDSIAATNNSAGVLLTQPLDLSSGFTLAGEYQFVYSGLAQGQGSGSRPAIQLKAAEIPPVPLPAAAWMLIAALGGLGVLRRARKVA